MGLLAVKTLNAHDDQIDYCVLCQPQQQQGPQPALASAAALVAVPKVKANSWHYLTCTTALGGSVISQRHHSICHILREYATIAGAIVEVEPKHRFANNEERVDLEVLLDGKRIMIDVAVIDSTSGRNQRKTAGKAMSATVDKEKEKIRKYGQQCQQIQAEFIPFIIETHGGMGEKANKFIERLALSLSKHHAPTMTRDEFRSDLYDAIGCAVQRHNALIMQTGHVRSLQSLQNRANRRREIGRAHV